MNLDMIQPKTKTEDLLLSVTKNCETPIEQTHAKPEETLKFKLTQAKENFSFKSPIQIQRLCMLRVNKFGSI